MGFCSYLSGLLSGCLWLLFSLWSPADSLLARRLPSTPLFLQWDHRDEPELLQGGHTEGNGFK